MRHSKQRRAIEVIAIGILVVIAIAYSFHDGSTSSVADQTIDETELAPF